MLPDVQTSAADELSPTRAERDANGIDRTLIRSSLQRTPAECLEILEDLLDLAETARRVDGPIR